MRNRRGSIFEATVTDGNGRSCFTFFGRGRQDWRERSSRPGCSPVLRPGLDLPGKRQLAHPEYELLDAGEDAAHAAAEYAAEMIPVYPAAKEITSWQIARSVRVVLDVWMSRNPIAARDPGPPRPVRAGRRAPAGFTARWTGPTFQRSRNRLKWDEAFLLPGGARAAAARGRRLLGDAAPAAGGGLLDAYGRPAAVRADRGAAAGRRFR